MEPNDGTAEAVLAQLGMTAHRGSRGGRLHRDGALHFRQKSWPAKRQPFNPGRFNRQSLSRKQLPESSLIPRKAVPQVTPGSSQTASSLPDSLLGAVSEQDRSEIIASRRRKTVSFLQELQSKEHLRVAEARRTGELRLVEAPSADSEGTSEAGLLQSDLLFEQSKLGGKTRILHEAGGEIHARYSSSASDRSIISAESLAIELDGIPVPGINELPAEGFGDTTHTFYEYGDTRLNTLPGESYPLADRKPSIEPLDLGTLTEKLFDMETIEREALRDLVHPDTDPRTGLPFDTSIP